MDDSQFIPGIQATGEALAHGVGIHEIWITKDKKGSRIDEVLRVAGEKRIPVIVKKRPYLDQLFPGTNHQGIVALAEKFTYSDLDQLIHTSARDHHHALIVAADHITDEGNLGALIRTSAFFGVHGLILPKDRSARVTGKVLKRSSGAGLYLPVARVTNLRNTLDRLKKRGFWIIGAAGEGPVSIYRFDWVRDVVLILGREDRGLSPSVRDQCHQLVSIPSMGPLDSLNVSVAGGVVLSEIIRQRGKATR